jgi:hypothetical protein
MFNSIVTNTMALYDVFDCPVPRGGFCMRTGLIMESILVLDHGVSDYTIEHTMLCIY